MIWLEVKYVPLTTNTADGVRYAVMAEVINSSGIEREVFVHRTDDGRYMHPAMAYDMNVYPAGQARALSEGADFYRASTARVEHPASATAASALRTFKARLAILVRQWRDTQTEDLGDVEVEVYTSE